MRLSSLFVHRYQPGRTTSAPLIPASLAPLQEVGSVTLSFSFAVFARGLPSSVAGGRDAEALRELTLQSEEAAHFALRVAHAVDEERRL